LRGKEKKKGGRNEKVRRKKLKYKDRQIKTLTKKVKV
jgi:hypothetical protein